ncbi:MAG: hypothetical protein QOF92_2743 [Pseudonocardiales bacterium]|jgi:hypothetical protein|nr:hypothetical protein [Pseudonocardiales bacterium]
MSNHFSAANLKFPEDDARLDLTDLFAPDNPNRTVLIIDAHPSTASTSTMTRTRKPMWRSASCSPSRWTASKTAPSRIGPCLPLSSAGLPDR